MGGAFCIGGWTADDRSVRLLLPGSECHPPNTPFQIGDDWNLEFQPSEHVTPPHVEDVIVTQRARVGQIQHLGHFLRRRVPIWYGGPSELYERLLGWTGNGSGYISHSRGVPSMSTGFWMPDQPLDLQQGYYHYPVRYGARRLHYVGTQPAAPMIAAGTLVRVSLARWWAPQPDMEERCYLQLSGWY